MTECNQSGFGFEACGKREAVARFDGGTISSDGGAFLLRQTDRRLNLIARLAECFLDGRNQELIEHTITEMLVQGIYGLALGYGRPLRLHFVGDCKDPAGTDGGCFKRLRIRVAPNAGGRFWMSRAWEQILRAAWV